MDDRLKEKRKPQPPKKIYATPQLVEYGSIEKLTQTGSANIGDALMQMMACL